MDPNTVIASHITAEQIMEALDDHDVITVQRLIALLAAQRDLYLDAIENAVTDLGRLDLADDEWHELAVMVQGRLEAVLPLAVAPGPAVPDAGGEG